MFYDYDQNHQVETLYQNCKAVPQIQPYETKAILKGDLNQNRTEYDYEVRGANADAGINNTTWTQKNI